MKNKIQFSIQNTTWNIVKSKHLFESRNGKYMRDEFLDNNRYVSIFKDAWRNGLTQFRNKIMVINVPDKTGYFSILCDIGPNNNIFIITVFKGGKLPYKNFGKVHNRINLVNHIIPPMTPKEKQNRKMEKVFNDVDNERDYSFEQYANKTDIKRI